MLSSSLFKDIPSVVVKFIDNLPTVAVAGSQQELQHKADALIKTLIMTPLPPKPPQNRKFKKRRFDDLRGAEDELMRQRKIQALRGIRSGSGSGGKEEEEGEEGGEGEEDVDALNELNFGRGVWRGNVFRERMKRKLYAFN